MNYQPNISGQAIPGEDLLRLSPEDAFRKAIERAALDADAYNAHQRQLRIDTFACAAMQLIGEKQEGIPVYSFMAKECYDLAEAMEAERARRMRADHGI